MINEPDRRAVLAGGLAMASGRAQAQPADALVRVALKTAKGVITLDLNLGKAPITARNFLRYVDMRLYDRSSIYRVSHAPNAADYGLIQGGLRGERVRPLKPIAHESTLATGLSHKDGTISMGRGKPGTATSEFFICIGDHPGFDADPSVTGDNEGFAAFGQVADGMDVVRAIFALATSPGSGQGVMKGEILNPPVPILTARRITA